MTERMIRLHQDGRVAYSDHLNSGETVVTYLEDDGDIEIYVRRLDVYPSAAEQVSSQALAERMATRPEEPLEAESAVTPEQQVDPTPEASHPTKRPRKPAAKKPAAKKTAAKK